MLAVALLAALTLSQPGPPTGWDGVNPFRCELQQAGLGSDVKHPDADPYCVDFDKTHQNVTDGGLVEFLSLEPARTAAAVPKCFYFQSDHWRSAVVQDDASTKVYEWDGHYFFDKATGDGGVWVTNFNVNGRTADPSTLPGIPPEWAQYLGPGTGGTITHNSVDPDPNCVAKAAAHHDEIYAHHESAAGPNGGSHGCVAASGPVTRRRLGPVALGARDGDVRARLGDPKVVRRGFLRYCVDGGGVLLVGQPGDRSGELGSDPDARTVLLLSTAVGVHAGRVHPGSRVPRAARRVARLKHVRVVRLRSGVLAGVRGKRVRWVAVSARRKGLRGALRRALTG